MTGGFGGIVSFSVRGGRDAAARVLSRLQLPRVAASVGGVTSLVAMPAALWKSEMEGDKADATGFPSGLIRYATGIEAPGDLIADLDAALNG